MKGKTRYWVVFGTASYLAIALSSIIRSLHDINIAGGMYLSVEWLAACIPYFFLGAIIGFAIDCILAKQLRMPLWLWLTLGLWAAGSVLAAVFAQPGILSPEMIIFFPFVFAVFFAGSAYVLLVPKSLEPSIAGKIIFDILYLGIFSGYIYAILKKKRIARILLILLFMLMFLGLGGCIEFLH